MRGPWDGTRELRYVGLPVDNVDTDQIIPARYLTTTRRDGLGPALFVDRRGTEGFENLDEAGAEGATALVVGANFGCGSSREHAVWALWQGGFRMVLGPGLADIFRHNALENGLLAIEISDRLASTLLHRRFGEVVVDLESCSVSALGIRESFSVEPFARYCLLQGLDPFEFLLQQVSAIADFENHRLDSEN